MSDGRILVVDDLPDVRNTVVGLLADEGYEVHGAATYEEAIDLLNRVRFHVAVLDIRLDESDVDNEAGLRLMHYIRQFDPTISPIILTGYAEVHMVQEALRPGKSGKSPAFSFLEKTEITLLPEIVKQAFSQSVRVNRTLVIEDNGEIILALARRLRFQGKSKPEIEFLAEEIDELLRKLFFTCEHIVIDSPQQGYSAAAVFKVVPWYKDRIQGEALIVKIGERGIADEEVNRYQEYVLGKVGGHRVPIRIETTHTRSLTGILYTFAGLGFVQSFPAFFYQANVEAIRTVIRNLYLTTCRPWQRDEIISVELTDLRTVYFHHLWSSDQKLEQSLKHMTGKRHPFHLGDDEQLWLGEDIQLHNPVSFVRTHSFEQSTLYGIIHGDLQGYNVLIDHRQETWLIDFASTTRGPIAQDYALFEAYLLVSILEAEDWQALYPWYELLFKAGSLTAVPLLGELRTKQDIWKAHTAILTIRRLAFGDAVSLSESEYLISLLFNLLKLLTILNLPSTQRDFALIASSFVASRLANLLS